MAGAHSPGFYRTRENLADISGISSEGGDAVLGLGFAGGARAHMSPCVARGLALHARATVRRPQPAEKMGSRAALITALPPHHPPLQPTAYASAYGWSCFRYGSTPLPRSGMQSVGLARCCTALMPNRTASPDPQQS